MNVMLFGNRIFADVLKSEVSSCVKVVPNPVSGVLLKTWMQTQRGQCHGMMEAEPGVVH